ncbi:MAG: hypothetical protein DRN55_08615 [Thermoplasmata archaeon]|nr:MAG: hypothetical protein DRN55_08615 [Thermoplasmata archaeon]
MRTKKLINVGGLNVNEYEAGKIYYNKPFKREKLTMVITTLCLILLGTYIFSDALMDVLLYNGSLKLLRIGVILSGTLFFIAVLHYFGSKSSLPPQGIIIKNDSIVIIREGRKEVYRYDDLSMYGYHIEEVKLFFINLPKIFILRAKTKDSKMVELSGFDEKIKNILIKVFEEKGVPYNEKAIKWD